MTTDGPFHKAPQFTAPAQNVVDVSYAVYKLLASLECHRARKVECRAELRCMQVCLEPRIRNIKCTQKISHVKLNW
jgi:hypothetical protein